MPNPSHPDRGYLYERTEHDPLEKALADHWEMLDLGNGQHGLTNIVGRKVTKPERYVAASVVQWLGTNCGFSFLAGAFAKCGYAIHGSLPTQQYFYHEDPLILAIGTAQIKADWLAQVDQAGKQAAQLLFDLSEPN